MAKTLFEAILRFTAVASASAIFLVSQATFAAVVERPSVHCPGAIETVNVDDNTGTVINIAAVTIPSGATATCVTNPGVFVQFVGSGSTLINNVIGLEVIDASFGNSNSIVNNGNIPFVIMSGTGANITNNTGGSSGAINNVGFAILGDNGIITNSGAASASGADSAAIGIIGDMPQVTNIGTAFVVGSDATAIGLEGDSARISNIGTATAAGDDSSALFIEGNTGTIENSGTANATGDGASGAAIEGDTATVTNNGNVTANGFLSFGMSAVGQGATLTNNGNVTTNNGALAAMGALGDDATLSNQGTIDTAGANGLGMGALGGVGALGQGAQLTNEAGANITTGGDGAHAIALGLENLTAIASGVPLPPGATVPAQGTAVNNGTIVTSGAGADGLHAFALGGSLENRGTITTGGTNANGMEARGSGAATLSATNLNLITASGDNASAMYGTGQNVSLVNGRADGSAPGAELDVNTGTGLRGMSLDGVDSRVENYGDISVTAGAIPSATSFLDFSHGIVVQGGQGSQTTTIGGVASLGSNNTVINKGTISANTQAGRSILVDTKGVTVENQAGGMLKDGILFTPGSSGVVNNAGMIEGGIVDEEQAFVGAGTPQVRAEINNAAGGTITGSQFGIGMYEADGFVTNDGTIGVSGPNAAVAVFLGIGTSNIVNRGTITTNGTDARAIGAFSIVDPALPTDQQGSALAANIQNFGTITAGKGIGTRTDGNSSILNAGTITTTASDGDAIEALTLTTGADIDAFNQGSITTGGDDAVGISAAAADGKVRLENAGTGTITTGGTDAFGMVAFGGQDDGSSTAPGFIPAVSVLNSGTVTTGGTGAHGLLVGAQNGDTTVVNRGTVTVASNTANAVRYSELAFGGTGFDLTNEAGATLSSPGVAILGSQGGDKVANKGTIIGDVSLFDGSDTYTVHDGSTVTGTVVADLSPGNGDTDRLVADIATNHSLNADQFQGFERFDKTGAGQLDFMGTLNLPFSPVGIASTNVQQGSLMLQAGSNLISDVNVAAGATIGGAAATVSGNISGAGTIAPGLSPGQLDVIGDIDLSGKLAIEIAGLGTGQFDVLNVAGNMTFQAAEIEISFLNSFVPLAGDVFPFLNVSGTVTGFETVFFTFLGAPQGFNFNVALNPLSGGGFGIGLSAMSGGSASVPEPESLALFVAGLGGLFIFAGRRRRRITASA